MDLNNSGHTYRGEISTALKILGREMDHPSVGLSPSLQLACDNYASRNFKDNLEAVSAAGPAVLQHLEGHVRAESALMAYRSKTISRRSYLNFIRSDSTPGYLRDYYIGIDCYMTGEIYSAYDYFSNTKIKCRDMILLHNRYFDGTIRGAMSAKPFSYLTEALDDYDPARIDRKFRLDMPQPRAMP
jgi:hypothetical protein